ncbi:MAG: hypothetical protein QG620_280 [Patescibacteria group bacterium]|nr:hypothetical protein [Patescibacteria group bacterium]
MRQEEAKSYKYGEPCKAVVATPDEKKVSKEEAKGSSFGATAGVVSGEFRPDEIGN